MDGINDAKTHKGQSVHPYNQEINKEAIHMGRTANSFLGVSIFPVLLLFAAFISLLPITANADDASYEGHGATVYLVKEERIRMVSETVNIRYNPKALKDYRQRDWLADCTFRFENLTDKAVDVQMGFPDWRVWSESLDDEWAIGGFEVAINGKKVQAVRKEVKPTKGEKRVLLPGGLGIPYEASYTWQVLFEPHAVLTVYNRYAFGGFSSNGPFFKIIGKKSFPGMPVIERRQLFWAIDEQARRKGPVYDNSAYRELLYIVTTGLSWAGNIGEANISIQFPPQVLPHLVIPLPGGYRVRNGEIRWEFRNWRPQSEIAVYSLFPIPSEASNDYAGSPIFYNIHETRAWIKLAKENSYDRDTVSILWNAVLAKYGFKFSDVELRRYFEQFHWYEPKREFSYDDVSPEDKRIIALLKDFERSLPDER